jgi:hypothetical protein
MALDSDIHNADSHLQVEFYINDQQCYKDRPTPFVRIIVPGDKNNIVDQPVKEDHKERFPRQWLYFQMQRGDGPVIGTLLQQWNAEDGEGFNIHQMAELHILKFQTVEQVATASDSQLQRIGMGGAGLREKARSYLIRKNQTENTSEIEVARRELDELKKQMAMLMETRKPGRPRKEA